MPSHVDKEKAKKTISFILDKLATEEDIRTLGEYHDIFKKEVSFFRRSWAAAYLLMLCDQGKNLRAAMRDERPGTEKTATRKAFGEQAAASKEPFSDGASGDDAPKYFLTEEESRWLFFSAGRSRRVFPREILGIINAKTAVAKEDIGMIRIFDNYSFVQVRDSVTDKIIEALNGVNFRGRSLTVNYAKFRKEEENGAGENGNGYAADIRYTEEQPEARFPDSEQNSEQT